MGRSWDAALRIIRSVDERLNHHRRRGTYETDLHSDPVREAVLRYLSELEAGRIPHPEIEDAFCDSMVRYSIRLGIGAAAWRRIGVPESVMRRAGFD